MDTKIIKTLVPGKKGTRQLVQKYGDALLCVRYRVEEGSGVRYKTVEIVEKSWIPDSAEEVSGVLEQVESGGEQSEPGVAMSLVEKGELDAGRMFWFRFRGYVPELFRRVMRAGGRRWEGRRVWGVLWSEAEGLGLLDSGEVERIDIGTLVEKGKHGQQG